MTGFARVRATIQGVEATLSIKSVNHRALDLHFYMPPEMDPFESAMRTAIKKSVARGHVDVRVQLTRDGTGPIGVDMAKLEAYVRAFHSAAARFEITATPDLNAAFRVNGILTDSAPLELTETFEAPLLELLDRALVSLNEFRSREGAELGSVMLEQNASIHGAARALEELRANVIPAFQSRLRDRLSEMLANSTADPQRILQEAALLADRSDIGEEIARLKIHAAQIEQILRDSSEAGKRLDFLLQEMNRETNTILSKTAGVGEAGLKITEIGVQAKSAIEKIREQSLNLE